MQEAPPGMESVALIDPLDGHRFNVFTPQSTNGLGGSDSDGCAYSRGAQPRQYEIVTSPTTLFSAKVADWALPIAEAQKPPLAEMLTSLGRDVDDARALSPAERYELAAAVARQLGRGDLVAGELLLEGAWTVRDSIVGFLPNVQGASDAWSKFTETLPLVKAVDNDRGATIARFDMARLAHRGGFVHERDDMLELVALIPDAGVGADAKRVEFARRVADENRLLGRAREAFAAALLHGQLSAAESATARYLLGDLARRLGEFDRARELLDGVALDARADDATKARARDVLAVLKVQSRARTVPPPNPPESPK